MPATDPSPIQEFLSNFAIFLVVSAVGGLCLVFRAVPMVASQEKPELGRSTPGGLPAAAPG